MEKAVQVISVSTILPATYRASNVPQRIDFTPWDLQNLLLGPIQFGLVFDSNLTPELLTRLKESLSRTLDFFYPIAGRLSSIEDISKDSTLFYIECNNAGVEFTHAATAGITLADVLQPVYDPSIIRSLFAESGITCASKPFLALQATELANGGFFLSCTMSHLFGDGSSFWHFLNSWSEICRGSDSLENPPVLERCYPGKAEIWIPNSLLVSQSPNNNHLSHQVKEKIFIIPPEKIALLKQNVIKQTGNPKISSLQSLLAFVLKLTSRYHQIDDEDILFFGMAVNARTRTEPPLPEYYLGNVVHSATTFMKVKNLREDALTQIASTIHDIVASQSTGVAAHNFLTSWVEKPSFIGRSRISNGKKLSVVIITSSPKFDVYGNDFGWGGAGSG